MATGSSTDKSAIDRRLFQEAHISPLEAVRDFFEAISELRAAADNENTRYLMSNYEFYCTSCMHSACNNTVNERGEEVIEVLMKILVKNCLYHVT